MSSQVARTRAKSVVDQARVNTDACSCFSRAQVHDGSDTERAADAGRVSGLDAQGLHREGTIPRCNRTSQRPGLDNDHTPRS